MLKVRHALTNWGLKKNEKNTTKPPPTTLTKKAIGFNIQNMSFGMNGCDFSVLFLFLYIRF